MSKVRSKTTKVIETFYLVRWYEESDSDQQPHDQQCKIFPKLREAENFAFEISPTATVYLVKEVNGSVVSEALARYCVAMNVSR